MEKLTQSISFIVLCCLSAFTLAQSPNLPSDFLTMDFHRERREALRDKLRHNSVAIFFSNPVRNRANDVQYVYHQDPDFYYFTGHREPHSVLLIFKDNQAVNDNEFNEIIFVMAHDALREL